MGDSPRLGVQPVVRNHACKSESRIDAIIKSTWLPNLGSSAQDTAVLNCQRCLYVCQRVFCQNCAIGYGVEPPQPKIGDQCRLVKVYEMELKPVDGVMKRKVHKQRVVTDTFLEVTGHVKDFGFIQIEETRFCVENVPCPSCNTASLRFDGDFVDSADDLCPKCGKNGLVMTLRT